MPKRITIGTSRIEGLTYEPHYDEENHYFYWKFTFTDSSMLLYQDLSFVCIGDDREAAKGHYAEVCEKLRACDIREGEKVAVLSEDDGKVIAIAGIGEETWIDVKDWYTLKSFKDLFAPYDSLRVF